MPPHNLVMLSCYLCQIVLNFHHAGQSYRSDTTMRHKSLCTKFVHVPPWDLDIQASNMLLVCDTFSCHDDRFWWIILKSHHAWQSYGSGTSVTHYCHMHTVHVPRVTLTFKLATWFLHGTHSLVMMIICAKYIWNPTMQDKDVNLTRVCVFIAYA